MKNKRLLVIICCCLLCLMKMTTTVDATSWYAGTAKWGGYYGIEASITTPYALPILGSNGESSWVTNEKNGNWIQTGIRYYVGYLGFRIYVETYINNIHNLNEIGYQGLGVAKLIG